MVAGHIQEKKGLLYMVLSYKDSDGNRKTKWMPTGLPVKGNKKKSKVLLIQAQRDFDITAPSVDDTILFSDFMLRWLGMMKNKIELDTYAAYAYAIKNRIAPYFKAKGIRLGELEPRHIQSYYQYEMTERKVSPNTVIHYHANI